MEKQIRVNPLNEKHQDRDTEISAALEAVPDLGSDEMASICTKMHYAHMMGYVQFTDKELASLKALSTKFIPDAPRHITVEGKIKTENVLIGWLENNPQHRRDANVIAAEYKVIEEQHNSLLLEAGFEADQ